MVGDLKSTLTASVTKILDHVCKDCAFSQFHSDPSLLMKAENKPRMIDVLWRRLREDVYVVKVSKGKCLLDYGQHIDYDRLIVRAAFFKANDILLYLYKPW